MKVALFGATGRTGEEVIRLAAERGWPVRALARHQPSATARPGVEWLQGSLDSAADVAATLTGAEVVLTVFGPRTARDAPFRATATRHIVAAMRAAGQRRLLCITGAMVGVLPPNVSWAMRAMAGQFRRQCPLLAEDSTEQERIVMASGLDWTLVKPPRLADGPPTGRVRSGPRLRVGLMSHVRRADVAAFMLDEAEACRHVRERTYLRG